MASFIINLVGTIASIAIPVLDLAKANENVLYTSIEIGVGTGPNTGGSVPHVALWDKQGSRIGQFRGDANGHIDDGKPYPIAIENTQTVPKEAQKQPEYLMVAMQESDAICIAYIYATGDAASWAWFGDMGWTCGADWYPSDWIVGSGTYTPKCVWIDQDHSNGLRFQGLSLHMPDFASQDGRIQQYNDFPDTLCKSKARMNFWDSIVPDAEIPTFTPPLKYNPDGTDVDIGRVVDKSKRKNSASSRFLKRDSSNTSPGHLVVSDFETHSAKEVCESDTSMGPDFISTVEGVFCDMETKEWWYLCSATITTGCFDMNSQTMAGNAPDQQSDVVHDKATGRILPSKAYNTSVNWNPSGRSKRALLL